MLEDQFQFELGSYTTLVYLPRARLSFRIIYIIDIRVNFFNFLLLNHKSFGSFSILTILYNKQINWLIVHGLLTVENWLKQAHMALQPRLEDDPLVKALKAFVTNFIYF